MRLFSKLRLLNAFNKLTSYPIIQHLSSQKERLAPARAFEDLDKADEFPILFAKNASVRYNTLPVQINSLSTTQVPVPTPSAQMGAHKLRLLTTGRSQFCYRVQADEYPSPLTRLRSL